MMKLPSDIIFTSYSYPKQPTFRSPRNEVRKKIRGGRWRVRKYRLHRDSNEYYWRAWSSGQASNLTRRFDSFEDAIAWADLVSYIYAYIPKLEPHNQARAVRALHQIKRQATLDAKMSSE